MTANQINYFKAKEEVRSHQANEGISRVANDIAQQNATTNLINASTNRYKADIDLLGQGIYYYATRVAERNAETNYLNALINAQNASLRERELLETERTHQFYEGETYRHNVATEQLENQRLTDLAWYNQQQVALGYGELTEKARANKQNENLRGAEIYHNYELGQQELKVKQAGMIQEDRNLDLLAQRNTETVRHNVATETLGVVNNTIGLINNWATTAVRLVTH